MGGLEIEPLKSINISGPRRDSAQSFFSVAPCVLHLNLQLDQMTINPSTADLPDRAGGVNF